MAPADELSLFDDDLMAPTGHPERFTTRWRLVGAGLSNVWRYGDLLLTAPSGRLLLRGPNGTGKTTALEALWPYLLDLNAQRLAAGKARPTSLALLMREGADGHRRRCGYLWLTFAAPGGDGVRSYGVRLMFSESGSPAVRVMPFTAAGVPLKNFDLYGPNRAALSNEQFGDTIAAADGTVFDDEDSYVAHLATHVWRTADRPLIELANRVRAVRNPSLLGDVSPKAAADALREALPGVSDEVVTATAEALAESEATRAAFQRDHDAAAALERFAEAWAGHVIDVVSGAHTAAASAQRAVRDAERNLARVARSQQTAIGDHEHAVSGEKDLKRQAGELDVLIGALEESEAYQAAGRLADMQKRVDAENRTAAAERSKFAESVAASRSRAENLRATAAEIIADLDDLFGEAAAIDNRATPDHPLLTCTSGPRPAFPLDETSVDPGPGAIIRAEPARAATLAAFWRELAAGHRRGGNDARLALTDRRETDTAEREAAEQAPVATRARVAAEAAQRQLSAETAKTQQALRDLTDAIDTWYDDHHELTVLVGAGWHRDDADLLSADEPAQILISIDGITQSIRHVGAAAVADLKHRATLADAEATRLTTAADQLRDEARTLREGKLLPVPRPEWAGPAPDGHAFADAVDWHPSFANRTERALVETALAASGLLGAALHSDGVRTDRWQVDSTGEPVAQNLTSVLITDPSHPQSRIAVRVLHRVALHDTSTPSAGLVIGRDGSYTAGPLHGRPPQLANAEHVGAAQRRAAALARADALDVEATGLDAQATEHHQTAQRLRSDAGRVEAALSDFPKSTAAGRAEANRAAAATRAAETQRTAEDAAELAAQLTETARTLRLAWEQRTRARHLPIGILELQQLRDDGERRARELDAKAKKLQERVMPRLDRLAGNAADDQDRNERLNRQHADAAVIIERATRLAAEHQALIHAVGLDAATALAQHAEARGRRDNLDGQLSEAAKAVTDAEARVRELGFEKRQAERRIDDAGPPLAAALRRLRVLLDVNGVSALLPVRPDHDAPIDALGSAVAGKRTVSQRLLRERYDTCRTELAGLWTLDPGDTVEGLDTYLLTHDGVGYAPPDAADAGRQQRDRAQQALNRAEESALRDFVIGRLPLAIGTAWVHIEDWVQAVNRKMRNASASSGVGVRIARSLSKDLTAAEATVHRLACTRTTLTAAEQIEVGEALQALIAAAPGATMAEQLTHAIDVRQWLDISYEIVRPDGQAHRWTSKTGLSGGERRLVVLAPMLAAVAAYYDQLGPTGLRLTALDEVPAEVDERGREGLARYLAELDLDLICTSYLWDGSPGAWDGIDAWDLEAGPDTTVVAFPMLVRGLHRLPEDPA
ncbi:SbcC/MukB-like Walker B domain-containing protein [Paractinoplanes lichenicola]|uniref:TIGR02680 family protein n=1 Tax=Paractinoplanes lichenicola TaxID=2802976 RepID=A0ABS1W4C4_9ACTN|nr:SbcC/MukB-like Walker B domain-containing protein [Actinoplanes lichenicola]MBL7261590.1 hypothetical protein [Actinoplanes lichenicola]